MPRILDCRSADGASGSSESTPMQRKVPRPRCQSQRGTCWRFNDPFAKIRNVKVGYIQLWIYMIISISKSFIKSVEPSSLFPGRFTWPKPIHKKVMLSQVLGRLVHTSKLFKSTGFYHVQNVVVIHEHHVMSPGGKAMIWNFHLRMVVGKGCERAYRHWFEIMKMLELAGCLIVLVFVVVDNNIIFWTYPEWQMKCSSTIYKWCSTFVPGYSDTNLWSPRVIDCAASKKIAGRPSFEVYLAINQSWPFRWNPLVWYLLTYVSKEPNPDPCSWWCRVFLVDQPQPLHVAGGLLVVSQIISNGKQLECRVPYQNHLATFQEKALVQGWKPMGLRPDNLSARELGMALGNAWPLNVSAKLIEQLNKCMGWQPKDWSIDEHWHLLEKTTLLLLAAMM